MSCKGPTRKDGVVSFRRRRRILELKVVLHGFEASISTIIAHDSPPGKRASYSYTKAQTPLAQVLFTARSRIPILGAAGGWLAPLKIPQPRMDLTGEMQRSHRSYHSRYRRSTSKRRILSSSNEWCLCSGVVVLAELCLSISTPESCF